MPRGAPKGSSGNVAYQPTDKDRGRVEALAGYGIPEHQIARDLNIAPKTLRKYYRNELDTAHIRANAAVAQSLFKKATGDGPQSVTACIFWCKTRMGWRDVNVVEHTGADGGPIEVTDAKSRLALLLGRKPDADADQPGSGWTQ